jgi:prophage regulatory protein
LIDIPSGFGMQRRYANVGRDFKPVGVYQQSTRFNMSNTILRIPAAMAESGYSRATIYLRISQGLWPRPVSLGPRCVGFPADEIAALNGARISGKSDSDIRNLVVKLLAARSHAV